MDKKTAQKATGKRIRAARLGADITQTKLSLAIGGPENSRRISQLETGDRPAKIEELQKMGELFDVPWSQLLHGDDQDKAAKATELVDSIYTGAGTTDRQDQKSKEWITVPLFGTDDDPQYVPVLRAQLAKMMGNDEQNLHHVCLWEQDDDKLVFLDLTPYSIEIKDGQVLAQIAIIGSYC